MSKVYSKKKCPDDRVKLLTEWTLLTEFDRVVAVVTVDGVVAVDTLDGVVTVDKVD